ncbi:MAG: MFS transporter [Acidimicrobiales bacterium]
MGELRSTPYGVRPVLVLGVLILIGSFDAGMFNLAGPEFLRRGNINLSSIISVLVGLRLLLIFTNLGVGWAADRVRRVPMVGWGTILGGAIGSITGRGRTSATVGAPRAGAQTASAGFGGVPLYSLVADYYPVLDRGRAFAALNALDSGGIVFAPLVAGALFKYVGLFRSFLADGVAISLSGALVLALLREPIRGYFDRKYAGADDESAKIPDAPQSFGEAFRTFFAVRTLRRIFVARVAGGLVAPAAGLYLLLFLPDHYGISILAEGGYFSIAGLGTVLGSLYGGGLVDRLSAREPGRVMYVYGAFLALTSLSWAAYALSPPLWVIGVLLFVFGFGSGLTGPGVNAIATQVIPSANRTQGLQVLGLSDVPASVVGFGFSTVLFFKFGYPGAFWPAAAAAIIGGILYASSGSLFELDRRTIMAGGVAAEEYRQARDSGRAKMLVCRGVDVGYESNQVIFNLDFDVEQGEVVALLGTNGAGKSTLLRAISGITEASGGSIVFEGRDITHMPPHEIAARGVVHMPGGRGVFPAMSVRDNLRLSTWLLPPDEALEVMNRSLDLFPVLRDRVDVAAGTLSGGEQQMLSLAQAMVLRPKLLLIDELSLGLAPAVVGMLIEAIEAIRAQGVTIIVVEQSINVALQLAHRAVFLEKGEVQFEGPSTDLLNRPDVLRSVFVQGAGGRGRPATAPKAAVGALVATEEARRTAAMAEARVVLEARGIAKAFGGVRALEDVSFELRDGAVLGIIGPNGSGKTTLFDLLSGLVSADSGQVWLEGTDVTELPADARARLGLLRRFQDARLYPSLTVEETLLVALEQQVAVKSAVLHGLSWPSARRSETRARQRAATLLESLGLGRHQYKLVGELSTGLRRILDLGCVMAAEPHVVLLDEPSAGIAQAEAEALGPVLLQVRRDTGCSMMIIEHDMPLISAVSDQLIAMDQGRILLQDRPDVVLADSRVVAAYLGTSTAATRRSGSLV